MWKEYYKGLQIIIKVTQRTKSCANDKKKSRKTERKDYSAHAVKLRVTAANPSARYTGTCSPG